MKIGRQWEDEPANSPDVVHEYFKNNFSCWTSDMTQMLQKFINILGEEKDEDGAGLNSAKQIKAELYRRKNNIPQFTTVSKLLLPHLNEFLFSTHLNPPIVDQVHHDMTAPLSHYFIHTSLNSFFIGNPLLQGVSDAPIIDALKQGVRVIELDIWPCGKDGICVKRRWTWETLELQKCLDAIKVHAFTATKTYPVIITFKDRLKPDLQSKATEMINQTLGNMVYFHDPNSSQVLLSPAELQNKVIITRRPPKEVLYANDAKVKVDVRVPLKLVHPNYQRLVAFPVGEPAGMLLEALTQNAKKIQRQGSYETDVIRFTQEKFLRTRLKRKSLIHGHYKPQRGWVYGAQMIALSKQEYNKALWLMQGMFRANGGCGYVKKPDFLLNTNPSNGVFYPMVDPVVKKTLKVKVYMGDGWSVDFKTRLARLSAPDFYVMVSIAGVPHDEKIMKTTVKNNEWTPTWGDDEFTFPLTYPELALLSIEVYDHNVSTTDGFAGQTCLPVSELIQGIRAVPLYDEKGEKCSSTMLLMRFKLS